MKYRLPIALIAVATSVSRLVAASFGFQSTNVPPDLLIGFRQTGGISELVADLGPVSRFYGAVPGTNFVITEFTSAQLTDAFSGLDSLGFVACAAMRVDGDPTRPLQTVWATRKRSDPATQSQPWNRQSSGLLANSATKISSIGSGAATYSGSNPPGPDNTATAVILPASYSSGYSAYLGNGNFKSTFQGNAENLTPSDFTENGGLLRSDLYELRPGSGQGVYLGYFEFTSAGVLSFTAAGGDIQPAPAPTITAITRSGDTTTVSFTTVVGASYQLLSPATGGLTGSTASWAAKGSSVAGTGSVLTLTDTSTDADAFYAVEAKP
ncbi:MAG TPA: hypothetical protein VMB21_21790 [Candidatus Limnocylindria bacterium]|nr:hypothetical protein [Candidatus Limnocylindria bacterium]